MRRHVHARIATMAMIAAIPGCTDLKPIQAQVDELKNQVARLQKDLQSAREENAAAVESANGAQATASQALAAARGTDDKIERMFRRHVSQQ
jgi:outer membrane murein-binding lipoprotein Lpp